MAANFWCAASTVMKHHTSHTFADVDLQGLPKISRGHADTFFVQFAVDDTTLESRPKKFTQGHYRWTDNYRL